MSISIDHYPATPTLPGYRERRLDVDRWQQWLLDTWDLDQVVQNGQVIIQRHERSPVQSSSASKNSSLQPLVKSATYFEHDRPDVLELVPSTAQRVLDIGCGSGRLGAALQRRQGAHVTGIELNPKAAAQARQSLDAVYERHLEQDPLPFETSSFDCVICAECAGASALAGDSAAADPRVAHAGRLSGHQSAERSPSQRGAIPFSGELDLRISRTAGR
ncbi:class I SAM-dependent methyltransferase [Planctomicrobium sp. SH664]|uniref:class I SAM-dependent methyltransferase n=1 Tax=Planctomicrobium sp. SH664 TaxID=3448125 RepID=UPI003F5B4A30